MSEERSVAGMGSSFVVSGGALVRIAQGSACR